MAPISTLLIFGFHSYIIGLHSNANTHIQDTNPR